MNKEQCQKEYLENVDLQNIKGGCQHRTRAEAAKLTREIFNNPKLDLIQKMNLSRKAWFDCK